MTELTVKLHELVFVQDLIVLLGDTHAAFLQQQHCYTNSGHNNSHGVHVTTQLHQHFDGGTLVRKGPHIPVRGYFLRLAVSSS